MEVLTRPECERPYIPIAGRVEVAAVRIADALPAHQPVGANANAIRDALNNMISAINGTDFGANGFDVQPTATINSGAGSLQAPRAPQTNFDFTIFDRPLAGPDYAQRTGPVYQLIWGRHMSPATVKAHVSQLLIKLNAANRVQIALLVQGAATSRPPSSR